MLFLLNKIHIYGALCGYVVKCERTFGFKVQSIRHRVAEEHEDEIVSVLMFIKTNHKKFHLCMPTQSNGCAEHFI